VGEALPMFMPTFNRSLVIEARPERLSSDGGAVLLREVLERSGIIPWMVAPPRRPTAQDQVTYRLEELLRTVLVLSARAGVTRMMPMRCASIRRCGWPSPRRGTAALCDDYRLPSQPTMSLPLLSGAARSCRGIYQIKQTRA
jgi:hypothetical protein